VDCGGEADSICFFRICIAFIKRIFSGVIMGDLGPIVLDDIKDLTELPELVFGRPPLV
jgi:hypothetical protein